MSRQPARRGPRTVRAAALLWVPLLLLLASLWAAPPAGAQFTGDFTLERHTLDPENFLDWKAYQPPHPWRYDYLRAPNYFRGTVGSLSQKAFYLFQEVRLEKSLGAYGSVHYHQQEDSFFRPEPLYQEFEVRLGRTATFSLMGFPRHRKVLGAMGFAAAYGSRTDWDYLRVSRLKQFDLFNEEHVGEERFDPPPVLRRLEARTFWRERVLVQVDLRDERPAALLSPSSADPAQGRRETYRGRKAEVLLDVHWSERLVTGLELRRHREHRGREPYGSGSTVTAAAQELEYDWLDAYATLTLSGGSRLEAGAYRGRFVNRIDDPGADFSHHLFTDALYVLWSWPRSDTFLWRFSFQMGQAERATADAAAPDDDVNGQTTELKAGVGVVLHEAGSYAVFFNSTWDLDIFTDRQWDGGNVQVLWLF